MKRLATGLVACALLAPTACSTAPVSAPIASVQPVFQARITQFQNPTVNEAASACVAQEKLKAYETLAQRPNGLETFSCEIAGLSVDRTNVRY